MINFNKQIIKNMKKELDMIKIKKKPINEHNEKLLTSLYVYLKDLEVTNLIFERWKYGFDITYDIHTLTETKLKLSFNENNHTDFIQEQQLPIYQNITYLEPSIDEKLNFISKDRIHTFSVLTEKEKIQYEDLLEIKQRNIV